MRTIKFRAWDKENNCWYKPTHEAYKGNLWELLLGFSGDLVGHTIKDGISVLVHESVFPDRYVINLFTGLIDKDGKEIYEGDIVQWEDSTGDDMYGGGIVYPTETVEFNAGAFYPVCMMPGGEFEIIGNIYENSELLNN